MCTVLHTEHLKLSLWLSGFQQAPSTQQTEGNSKQFLLPCFLRSLPVAMVSQGSFGFVPLAASTSFFDGNHITWRGRITTVGFFFGPVITPHLQNISLCCINRVKMDFAPIVLCCSWFPSAWLWHCTVICKTIPVSTAYSYQNYRREQFKNSANNFIYIKQEWLQ